MEEHGLPELTSRGAMREGRDMENLEPTRFGPIIQGMNVKMKDGSEESIPIAHPFALRVCQLFQEQAARISTFARTPVTSVGV